MTSPRRGWSRFSLRTLFVVVTLISVYLGWAMSWVRQRRAFIARDVARQTVGLESASGDGSWIEPQPPWILRCFGESGALELYLKDPYTEEKAEMARRLFPEAEFVGQRTDDPSDESNIIRIPAR